MKKERIKAFLFGVIIFSAAVLAETITLDACPPEGYHSTIWLETRGEEIEVPVELTEEEFDLLCRCVFQEAGNQGEEGQRLVASVILNRMEHPRFPDNVIDVIKAPHQFTWASWSTLEVQNSVVKELKERTNHDVLYFRTGHYHNFGTPILQHGAHYFSGE